MRVLTGVCVLDGNRVHWGLAAFGSTTVGAGHWSPVPLALSNSLAFSIEASWQAVGSVVSVLPAMARRGRRSFNSSVFHSLPETSAMAAKVFPRSAHNR